MWPAKPAIDMQSNRPAVPIQDKMSMQQIVPQEDDKNCQVNMKSMCSDKNSQENQNINMWPVKPEMDMQSPRPAIPYKHTRLCSDKNCQSTTCYKKKDQVKSLCSNKNCQETKFNHMQPLKPEIKNKVLCS